VNFRLGPLAAWLLLAAIAFMTLAPIELRPSGISPQIERFAAFAVIGLVFSLAYSRQVWLVVLLVLGAAVALEVMQVLVLTRHAGLRDVVAKLAGGTTGVLAGWAISTLRRQPAATDRSG
jgi:hypothetical protein